MFSRIFLFLHIDDPVDASAVHLCAGVWGTLAAGLFIKSDVIDHLPNGAILYAWDGDAFIQFGIQAIGVAVIIAWSSCLSLILFGSLRLIGVLRVSAEAEKEGLDFDNGEPAYPMDPALLLFPGTSDSDSLSDRDSNTF